MREKFVNLLTGDGGLLRVRAILAFGLVALVAYGFIDGEIEGESVITLASGAVAFYFGDRKANS